jgi:hypothetical protein
MALAAGIATIAKIATDAVKASRVVPSRMLPLVAIGIGVLLALLASVALFGVTMHAAVVGILAGILSGGGAVGMTEAHKAARKTPVEVRD